MSSAYKFIYMWLNLCSYERGPVLEQSTQENSLKAYFINVLEYPKLVRCPPFRILHPTTKTQTPRDCFTKIKTAQYRFVS